MLEQPRIIVITGASSGIGEALAYRLAAQDIHLILIARSKERLRRVAKRVRAAGAKADYQSLDLSDPLAWPDYLGGLRESGLMVDDFYHCATRLTVGTVHHTHATDWQEIYQVNLGSISAILTHIYPGMKKRGEGRLIFFTSLTSIGGYPLSAPYCATKTSIRGLWNTLRQETKNSGVSAHLIMPGFVDTPLYENIIYRRVTMQQLRQCILSLRLPIVTAEVAADVIVRKVDKGKSFIVFPRLIQLIAISSRRFPGVARTYIAQAFSSIGIRK